MAFYYIVAAMETPDGGLTAAVPDGISWVGQPHTDGTYLIKTLAQIDQSQVLGEVTPDGLTAECQDRGMAIDDVVNGWAIGGTT